MQCACAIFSSVVCPALQYFSTLSDKRYHFRKTKLLTQTAFFSIQFLPETFLILRINEQDMFKIYVDLHVK